MLFKRKCETDKSKYKATYKSLHSGNTKYFVITYPEEAPVNFLQQSGDVWEMYMLVSVMPLEKADHQK